MLNNRKYANIDHNDHPDYPTTFVSFAQQLRSFAATPWDSVASVPWLVCIAVWPHG